MIACIRGRLLESDLPQVVVDVQGVGYELELTAGAAEQLPLLGEEVSIPCHLVVREDAQLLFGFASVAERTLFRSLIRVNGVGPKMALTLLSGLSAPDFARVVHEGDVARLTKLPGVGKKTAERLIVELRDRLPAEESLPAATEQAPAPSVRQVVADAESGLIALGYRPVEASRAIAAVYMEGLDTPALVRAALKRAGQEGARDNSR